GIAPGANQTPHVYTLKDSRFDGNLINVHEPLPSGSYPAAWQPPNTLVVENTTHGSPRSGGAAIFREIILNDAVNLIQIQRVLVSAHNGVAGDDFEVFMREQAPAFVIPVVGVSVPESNLTNAQAWTKYHEAVAGAVAPCSTTRSGIVGFVCPSSGPIPTTPTPTSSTPATPRNFHIVH